MQKQRAITLVCSLASVLLGSYAGFVDLHEEDVQGPVLILIGSALVVSAIQPARAWVFATIIGACIPLAHLYSRASGMTLPYPTSLPSTFLAMVPAFLGAGIGAALGKGAQLLRL